MQLIGIGCATDLNLVSRRSSPGLAEVDAWHNRPAGSYFPSMSATIPSSWTKPPLAALTLTVILAALYWPILTGLMTQWWDDANYTHGFLVPLFSAYLVWRERARLTVAVPHAQRP